jgi:hypothetical protein
VAVVENVSVPWSEPSTRGEIVPFQLPESVEDPANVHPPSARAVKVVFGSGTPEPGPYARKL